MTEVVETEATDTSEADFSKGFSEARVEAPAPAVENSVQKSEAFTEGEQPEKVNEKPAEAKTEVVPAGPIVFKTLDEFNAAVEKSAKVTALEEQNRRNFSQYGELKRSFEELRTKIAAGTATRKFTAETFKRINEELPGLGTALAQDLQDALGSTEVAQAEADAKGKTFDPDAYFADKLAPALSSLEARLNERAELRIVKSRHPDFDTVVKSPEFSAWLKTLPEDRQKTVRESEDGDVAAQAVTDFKGYAESQKKAKQKNTTRLETAVAPKGAARTEGPARQDEETDFNAGFKTADKRYGSR